jgi:hypothetical protein
VEVEWSNGWVENYEVTTDLSAEPGQRYSVLAYEKGRGQIPARDVRLGGYVSTPAKVLVYTVAVPVIIVTFALMAPFALVGAIADRKERRKSKEHREPLPTARPSKDCCFIWMEDGATGKVIAGIAPELREQPVPEPSNRY